MMKTGYPTNHFVDPAWLSLHSDFFAEDSSYSLHLDLVSPNETKLVNPEILGMSKDQTNMPVGVTSFDSRLGYPKRA